MMDYKEQIKHPKWQKKRLEILERDDFTCQCCLDTEYTLCVHHKRYIKNRMIWQYDNYDLITLCEDCHQSIHLWDKKLKDNIELLFTLTNIGSNLTDYKILISLLNILNEKYRKDGVFVVNNFLIDYIKDCDKNKPISIRDALKNNNKF
jgi:hypothetical protein